MKVQTKVYTHTIMKFPNKINIPKVIDFINKHGPKTKVYIGTDSERVPVGKKWFADYMSVVIVHIDGKHGAKVFGSVSREPDYDYKKNRPSQRLMTEVYKTAELFLELSPHIEHDIEVHLDINPDEKCGSSCVISQAIGYIKGVCNTDPKVKPHGFAASNAADHLKRIMGSR